MMHCNTNDFPPPGCDAALPGEGAHPAYFRPQIALVANKRVRLSPPPSRSSTPTPGGSIDGNTNQTQAEDMMEVAAGKDVSGDSDASSDWGDWADAMVATDDEPAKQTAAAAAITSRGNMGGLSGEQEEEEAWVRSMIEQGTDGSVVQDADSRAWDYVLQMAVQERGVRVTVSTYIADMILPRNRCSFKRLHGIQDAVTRPAVSCVLCPVLSLLVLPCCGRHDSSKDQTEEDRVRQGTGVLPWHCC